MTSLVAVGKTSFRKRQVHIVCSLHNFQHIPPPQPLSQTPASKAIVSPTIRHTYPSKPIVFAQIIHKCLAITLRHTKYKKIYTKSLIFRETFSLIPNTPFVYLCWMVIIKHRSAFLICNKEYMSICCVHMLDVRIHMKMFIFLSTFLHMLTRSVLSSSQTMSSSHCCDLMRLLTEQHILAFAAVSIKVIFPTRKVSCRAAF